jgi:hypothetical protein
MRQPSRRFLIHFLIILAIQPAACSQFTSPAREHELKIKENTAYWFDYEASRRGAVLTNHDHQTGKRIRICAEPSPDVAIARTQDILAKTSFPNVADGEAQAKFTEAVSQLGQRTETVMFLRESLFRLCELSNNADLEAKDTIRLYKEVIKAAQALAAAELKRAEVDEIKGLSYQAQTLKYEADRVRAQGEATVKERERPGPEGERP